MALIGKTGPDNISARFDYDIVRALTGNDWVGSDGLVGTELYGDAGNDVIVTLYDNPNLTAGPTLTWSQFGGEGGDTLYSNVSGSYAADAYVYANGEEHNDRITAIAGTWRNYSATLIGGLYDDWVDVRATPNGDSHGNSFDIFIDVGDSANSVTAYSGSDGIWDAFNNASLTIKGGINNDVISAIAHGHRGYGIITIDSSDGNDTIFADAYGGTASGATGTNLIATAKGGDIITAVTAGTNTIDSGEHNDIVKATAVAHGVAETLTNDVTAGSGNDQVRAEILVAATGVADSGATRLTNIVHGDDGTDVIHAIISGQAEDYAGGGLARNELYGGNHNDTLTGELAGTYPGQNWLEGGLGNDLLTVIGGEGNYLGGDGGRDTLFGGAGADVLSGGTGEDTMTGGGGADTFVFDLSVTGTDIIRDFQSDDRLHFIGLEDHGAPGLMDDLAEVTWVKDTGVDVRVRLDNGAPIVFEGLGDGTINSLDDFLSASQIVSDPWLA